VEQDNRERRRELMRKKSSLLAAKQSVNTNCIPMRASRHHRRSVVDLNTPVARNENIGNYINEMSAAIITRQKQISQFEDATDRLDSQYKSRRREIETEWEIKVERFKTLRKKVRMRERVQVTIKDCIESFECDSGIVVQLRAERKRLQRRIASIHRDQDYAAERSRESENRLYAIDEARRELNDRQFAIQQRRANLPAEEEALEMVETELNANIRAISDMEKEIAKLERANDEKIIEIQERTAQFEATRIARVSQQDAIGSLGFE
jgi:peptidoglycan hydrolase CwlO-like protein